MAEVEADAGLWIRRFHPAPQAMTRLVCFPHAGGSATFFRPVSQALSPAVDVLSVQYPGRQDRRKEKAVDSITDLADQIFAALCPWADRPVVLFGHSMGAIVAFEVARRFEREAQVLLSGLFVSGRRAPSFVRKENIHERDDDGIVRELKLMSGTDVTLLGDDEILRMILPAIRSDYKAVDTYQYLPGPKLACSIDALIGDADPKNSIAEAQGWSEYTSGSFGLHAFEGGHFYLSHHQAEINGLLKSRLVSPVSGGAAFP
jgi:surfactin synthase thioesterase subunit